MLDKLEITKVKSDETETIDLDHLFVNYGFKSSVGNLKNWGLDLNRHKIIVNSKQESSKAGIYAIGDCCYYEGKIDLIENVIRFNEELIENSQKNDSERKRIKNNDNIQVLVPKKVENYIKEEGFYGDK